MIRARTIALYACGLMLAASSLYAEDLSRYRDFTLGSTLAAVTKTSGVTPGDIKVIHERPAVIQELRWRPQRYSGNILLKDPVQEAVFSFYNDQLFLIVVDYDRQRTEGLTDADLVQSMAAAYGAPVLTATGLSTGARPAEPDDERVVARWADTTSSVTLLRRTYPTSLRLVVALDPVETLARAASVEAVRKDRQEAPQREVERQQEAAAAGRLAAEKARAANKPAFKP